jgi:hypothetical protein
MPRFLVLLSPPGEIHQRPVREWVARQAASGVIRSAARTQAGTRVARGAGVTTVGAADSLWGFLVVEAEDDRAALDIAASCPGTDPGTVQLYRLDLDDAMGEAAADAATLR